MILRFMRDVPMTFGNG